MPAPVGTAAGLSFSSWWLGAKPLFEAQAAKYARRDRPTFLPVMEESVRQAYINGYREGDRNDGLSSQEALERFHGARANELVGDVIKRLRLGSLELDDAKFIARCAGASFRMGHARGLVEARKRDSQGDLFEDGGGR